MARPTAASTATDPGPAPISRFPVPSLDDLPADLAERIGAMAERTGFVPNVLVALAHRPAELRAFLAYHDALMDDVRPDSALSKADREMIVVATQRRQLLPLLRRRPRRDPAHPLEQPAGRRSGRRGPPQGRLDEASTRHPATWPSASHVAPETVTDRSIGDPSPARAGLSDEDIGTWGAIVGSVRPSNRMAHLTAMRPNDEFFTMGALTAPPSGATSPIAARNRSFSAGVPMVTRMPSLLNGRATTPRRSRARYDLVGWRRRGGR